MGRLPWRAVVLSREDVTGAVVVVVMVAVVVVVVEAVVGVVVESVVES